MLPRRSGRRRRSFQDVVRCSRQNASRRRSGHDSVHVSVIIASRASRADDVAPVGGRGRQEGYRERKMTGWTDAGH